MSNGTTQLKEAMERKNKPAKVIAVTSGKGGVGKTNISVNLATCLRACNKKILLLDADFSLGNLDILLNTSCRYNISHFFSGKKTIDQIIHTMPDGLDIICGASGIQELAHLTDFQRQRLLCELEKISDSNDILIIDTGAGICKNVIAFCMAADDVLLVTTPEAPAMTDAYALIKVLAANGYSGNINLVVNMAESLAEAKKTYNQIARVAMRFLNTHIYNAGFLLKDDRLVDSVKQRKPVVLAYPKSQVTNGIIRLAAKLNKASVSKIDGNGFFKKVAHWFF